MKAGPPNLRQCAVATACADVLGTLVVDQDVSASLARLCWHCVRLFPVTVAGVLAGFEQWPWQVAATSDDSARRVFDVFARELRDGQGFGATLVDSGRSVTLPDLTTSEDAGDRFLVAARGQGYSSAYALPMRLRTETHGVLALFGTEPAVLSADDVASGEALAEVVTAGIVQLGALRSADTRVDQLQTALDSRVVIEQAKGALSARGGIDIDQAFVALRDYARSHNQPLHRLAGRIVTDDQLADAVLHLHSGLSGA